MFGTTPRNYIVTVRHWPDKTKPASETHDVPVVAYDVVEAMILGGMRFSKTLGGVDAAGGRHEAEDVRPAGASSATAADLLALLVASASKDRK